MKRSLAGFTLPELMVAQVTMMIMAAFLVFLYDRAYVAYDKGSSRMQGTQRAREALRRIAPLIGSGVPPQVNDRAIYYPDIYNTPLDTLILYGTDEYVYANAPPIPAPSVPTFNPSSPAFSRYRMRFEVDGARSPTSPGGQIGSLVLDPNTASTADDRVIARDLYDVTFNNRNNNTVEVQIHVYDVYRDAAHRDALQRYSQQTTVFIPFFTWK